MGAYKQFLSSDVVITPFEVNKGFTFQGGDALTGSSVGIDRYLGKNIQSSPFISSSAPTTGFITTQYQELVFDSIKHLYYSNFISSSTNYGAPLITASLIPGSDPLGNAYVGPTSSQGRYWNYPQTDLSFAKYFPTESNGVIGVISIPVGIYGTNIQPNSFYFACPSGSITDDGEGNIIDIGSGRICGNIFYNQGIVVLVSDSYPSGSNTYGSASYGSSVYGSATDAIFVENFITSSNITCSFSSSFSIFETQYKCTVNENEFNFTLNPSISSGSTQISSSAGTFFTPSQYLYDFATGSIFAPYITTVGLYDNEQNLLAIGKLAQPLQVSTTTDTTILINIDR